MLLLDMGGDPIGAFRFVVLKQLADLVVWIIKKCIYRHSSRKVINYILPPCHPIESFSSCLQLYSMSVISYSHFFRWLNRKHFLFSSCFQHQDLNVISLLVVWNLSIGAIISHRILVVEPAISYRLFCFIILAILGIVSVILGHIGRLSITPKYWSGNISNLALLEVWCVDSLS